MDRHEDILSIKNSEGIDKDTGMYRVPEVFEKKHQESKRYYVGHTMKGARLKQCPTTGVFFETQHRSCRWW